MKLFTVALVLALLALAVGAPQAALVPTARKAAVLGKGKTNPASGCSGAANFSDGCAVAIFGH